MDKNEMILKAASLLDEAANLIEQESIARSEVKRLKVAGLITEEDADEQIERFKVQNVDSIRLAVDTMLNQLPKSASMGKPVVFDNDAPRADKYAAYDAAMWAI